MARFEKKVYAIIEYFKENKTAFIFNLYDSLEQAKRTKKTIENWQKRFNETRKEYKIAVYKLSFDDEDYEEI